MRRNVFFRTATPLDRRYKDAGFVVHTPNVYSWLDVSSGSLLVAIDVHDPGVLSGGKKAFRTVSTYDLFGGVVNGKKN